jgi:AcrR family transcriptional regulator
MARKKDLENGQEMRLKFRSAFTKLLKERRWEQITIKEICAEAKVSLGLFYYYFESKEDVMREKYKAFDKALYEIVDNLSRGCNLLQSMFLYVSVYVAKCYEKGGNYMAQMVKFYMDDHEHHEYWHTKRGMFTILESLIDRAKTTGEIPDVVDSKNIANEFISALRGIVIQWCASNENYNLMASTNNLVRFYYLGLKQMRHHVFDSILNTEPLAGGPTYTDPVRP